uniref:Reverse transcriptase zinc-binding domain-containing protein n=1 Tax=Cajanus cajan TaxID=3821 RepID=A0A151QXA8_CAJCA|nr:hypothetical protein KK1_044003 [Cajanus cajan]
MHPYLWSKLIPIKISCFVWRAILNRIPTKQNLLRRKIIEVSKVHYVWCGQTIESLSHLFFECAFAYSVWV